MDFLHKIGNTITSTSKDVAQKAKDLTEIAKLSVEIKTSENIIKDTLYQLGKLYYKANKSNPNNGYLGLFSKINENETLIQQLTGKIRILKGNMKCKNCGADITVEDKFCPVCGSENEVKMVEEKTDASICRNCGQLFDKGSEFCSKCGEKVQG